MNGVEWFTAVIALLLILNGIFSRCYLWYVLDINTCAKGDEDCRAGPLRLAEQDRPCRILVVDDEMINRKLLRLILEPAGFEVVEADGADRDLSMALANHPRLVLMDVQMPGMDGAEATRRLRQTNLHNMYKI